MSWLNDAEEQRRQKLRQEAEHKKIKEQLKRDSIIRLKAQLPELRKVLVDVGRSYQGGYQIRQLEKKFPDFDDIKYYGTEITFFKKRLFSEKKVAGSLSVFVIPRLLFDDRLHRHHTKENYEPYFTLSDYYDIDRLQGIHAGWYCEDLLELKREIARLWSSGSIVREV